MDEQNEKLVEAVAAGNIDDAIDAIVAGASIHTKLKASGHSLLDVAMSKNHLEMFQWLLEIDQKGQKIDINAKTGKSGATLLLSAVGRVRDGADFVKALLAAGADPNIPDNKGWTPLAEAIFYSSSDSLDALMGAGGLDVNQKVGSASVTPLSLLFSSANAETLEAMSSVLLNAGADANIKNSEGKSALTVLMERAMMFRAKPKVQEILSDVASRLIDAGADVREVAVTGASALWFAAASGLYGVAKKIIDAGGDVGLMHSMATDEKTSVAKILLSDKNLTLNDKLEFLKAIQKAGIDINAIEPDGVSIATAAFLVGGADFREVLLNEGMDINSVYSTNANLSKKTRASKLPIVSILAQEKTDESIKLLKRIIKDGAKLSFEDEGTTAPIFTALIVNNEDAFNLLVDAVGKDLGNASISIDGREFGVIDLIAQERFAQDDEKMFSAMDRMRKIVEAAEENKKNGVESKLVTEEGVSAVAARLVELEASVKDIREKRMRMLDKLLSAGVSIQGGFVQTESGERLPPICHVKNKEMLSEFVARGGDIYFATRAGNGLMTQAMVNGNTELASDIMTRTSSEERVLYDVSFLNYDSHDERATMIGVLSAMFPGILPKKDSKDAVESEGLENVGVDFNKLLNYQDKAGNSPTIVAAALDNSFLMKFFIDAGADINHQNNAGETALMHAIAKIGDKRTIEFMIESGADVSAKNKAGLTVVDVAKKAGDKSIVKVIESALESGSAYRHRVPAKAKVV